MLGSGTVIQLVFLWRRQDCSSLHDHCTAGHPNKLHVGLILLDSASGHHPTFLAQGRRALEIGEGNGGICRLCTTALTLASLPQSRNASHSYVPRNLQISLLVLAPLFAW